MSHYMKANRCGWSSTDGWHYHRWICYNCGKKIKTVFKDLKGNDYCIKCFPAKKE